jgi:hypothetical protein
VADAPTRVASTKTSITVEWQRAADGGSPVTGYRLYKILVETGAETLAYDGQGIPSASSTRVDGLLEGAYYQYRVTAINRVGEGSKSPLTGQLIAA